MNNTWTTHDHYANIRWTLFIHVNNMWTCGGLQHILNFSQSNTVAIWLYERQEAIHTNLVHHRRVYSHIWLTLTLNESLEAFKLCHDSLWLIMTYCDLFCFILTQSDSPSLFTEDYESWCVTSLVIHLNMVWWDINKTKPCRVYKP